VGLGSVEKLGKRRKENVMGLGLKQRKKNETIKKIMKIIIKN